MALFTKPIGVYNVLFLIASLILIIVVQARETSVAMVAVRPVARLWNSYCVQLVQRPLLSRCLTGLVGGILSDFIAQKSVAIAARNRGIPPEPYDYARTARLVTYGFAIGTPLAYKWFEFLDTRIMPRHPTSPRAVMTKMLLDQLLMCPAGMVLFFFGIRTLEGRPSSTVDMLREKFFPLLKSNYMVWPAVHIVNFALIPSSQRILYLNVIGVMWGAWLAHLTMDPGPVLRLSDTQQPLLDTDKLSSSNEPEVSLTRRTPSGLYDRRVRAAGNKGEEMP